MHGLLADLAALARNPRRWWYRATHVPCPVCGHYQDLGRGWHAHKATHDPAAWRAALRPPTDAP